MQKSRKKKVTELMAKRAGVFSGDTGKVVERN